MGTCDQGNHNLVEIFSTTDSYGVESSVKWCSECGAVVVDAVCDNRLYVGRIMKMKFPNDAN